MVTLMRQEFAYLSRRGMETHHADVLDRAGLKLPVAVYLAAVRRHGDVLNLLLQVNNDRPKLEGALERAQRYAPDWLKNRQWLPDHWDWSRCPPPQTPEELRTVTNYSRRFLGTPTGDVRAETSTD
jgi:hypothetical protein